ncbi:flagellar protein FlgJ, putative [Rhodovulum sp. P5]|nr:flagellar protein FlgJ, putative [Rhodovulum sp. P5]
MNATSAAPVTQSAANKEMKLREMAEKLETQFLAEMLKHAGAGEARGEFGGGAGEEQFTSFLREAQAQEMVKAGGLGLSEFIFEALKERMDDAG